LGSLLGHRLDGDLSGRRSQWNGHEERPAAMDQ
jgi:hypothetical protein